MRMTILEASDTSLSVLLQRLSPNLAGEKLEQAKSALLQANPHLTASAAFKPGTVVVLPDTAAFKAAAKGSTDPAATTLELLDGALVAYFKARVQRTELALENLKQQAATLDAVVRANPGEEVGKLATQLEKTQHAAVAELHESQARQTTLLKGMRKDIAKLRT